jgi:hypothetical protein
VRELTPELRRLRLAALERETERIQMEEAAAGVWNMKDQVLDITIRVMNGRREISRHNEQIRVQTPSVDDFMRALISRAPVLQSKPPEEVGGVSRLWGFPIYENPLIPPGTALVGTPCDCSEARLEMDGGALRHLAKRHWVVLRFQDDTNEDRKAQGEGEGEAPAPESNTD